jgi:SAM-dependent methyltransferase
MLSMSLPIEEKMRSDWNDRARSDAYYYVASGRRHQNQEEFLSTGASIVPFLEATLNRVQTETAPNARRILEIGCGPGRLMLPLSRIVGEVHGIDVSDEMISLAQESLRDIPGAHLYTGTGSDLAPLPAAQFDYVYSFEVFQHIPSPAVVTRYLEEAVRVLKPGGVLCCQLRGAPSPPDAGESETWVGCVYPAADAISLCRRMRINVLQLTGTTTQYMWLVARKPLDKLPDTGSPSEAVLKAVTPTDNPYQIISPTGPGAAFQCWLEGFPTFASLENIAVTIDGSPADCCYISDHLGRGGFQLNVLMPPAVGCGTKRIRVYWKGKPVSGECSVEVSAYPELIPAIDDVTDGIDLLNKYNTTTGSLKILVTGLADPHQIRMSIDSHPIPVVPPQLCDPYLGTFEFAVTAPDLLVPGLHSLTVAARQWSQTVEVRSHTSE